MKRIIGLLIMLVGLVGVLISVAGTYYSYRFVDGLGAGIVNTLEVTQDSLATVEQSLQLTSVSVGQMGDALVTVEETADNVATAIRNTGPLLDQVSNVASVTVPESLEAFQTTIPNLVEVAGVIDGTMRTLSDFRIQRDLGLFDLDFDLGVDYDPESPFDESIAALGDTLVGVPEQLRSLDIYLDVTNENLQTISNDINNLADDINSINSSVAKINPLIDDYISIVNELEVLISDLITGIEINLQYVKIGLLVIFIWFGLNQILPFYYGWELLSGRRNNQFAEKPAEFNTPEPFQTDYQESETEAGITQVHDEVSDAEMEE